MVPPPPDFESVPDTGVGASPGGGSLGRIAARLAAIEKIENERSGAGKLTSRLLAIFGGLGTAIAIAFAALLWNGNAADAGRDAAIAHQAEKATENTSAIRHLADEAVELERRVDGLDSATKAVNGRLDRQSRQLDELLRRIPIPRARR